MRDWSLIDGIIPGAVMIVGALALVFLVARRERSWWLIKMPIALAVSAALVLGGAYLVKDVLQLFPDTLPTEVLVWLGVAVFAVLLAILRFPGSGWWSRLGGVLAALLVVLTAAAQINVYYAQYPTVGVLIGADKPVLVDLKQVGDHDSTYRPQQQEVFAACRRAGLKVEYHELPGAHSMGVWRPALVQALPQPRCGVAGMCRRSL